ncbi:hypothetical protein SKAU_G00256140 [Synaphobranchus kaupii]|uniref:Uncharacterized protein n=1 Tax=Synaphobranchus kaupii TaxID=118154 RepID=A0A9Q1F3Y2_SYNKA|nr:hypothetical protein SKAU_G00256140 [Synaphobranchus kaupii]
MPPPIRLSSRGFVAFSGVANGNPGPAEEGGAADVMVLRGDPGSCAGGRMRAVAWQPSSGDAWRRGRLVAGF